MFPPGSPVTISLSISTARLRPTWFRAKAASLTNDTVLPRKDRRLCKTWKTWTTGLSLLWLFLKTAPESTSEKNITTTSNNVTVTSIHGEMGRSLAERKDQARITANQYRKSPAN